jgi:hypothetical protein
MTSELTLTERDASHLISEAVVPVAASGAVAVTNQPTGALATLMTVADEILYAGTVHPELRVALPFEVRFERGGCGYAAVVDDIGEYGVGETRSDALEDLRRTLQELYLSLEQDEGRLSSDLRHVWERLRAHLVRIRQ